MSKEHNDYFSKIRLINKKVWALLMLILFIVLWNPISDTITIHSASPEMVKLAQDAGMSRTGELIFLRTNPELVTDIQMQNVCAANTAANNSNGFIEQGCYDPKMNRIYIRKMPVELYNMEVETASYEMLHPVYIRIATTDKRTQLDTYIQSNYRSINDDRLSQQVANFTKTEPDAINLELFSLIGTGYSGVSTELNNYYLKYFDNISKTVAAHTSTIQLFQSYKLQLTQINTTINNYSQAADTDYSYANTAYRNSVSWANIGNEYENNYNYNIYLEDFNLYKKNIDNENAAITHYNSVLSYYNNLITEYTGQQPVNQLNLAQSASH